MNNYAMHSSVANYDGTDITRPYLVDNKTGTPVYAYINEEDYHPPCITF